MQQTAATATTAEQVEQTLRQQGQGEGGGQGQAVQEGDGKRAAVSQAGGAGGRRGSGIKTRRVVVTGMGIVSCLGHDPDTFYSSLLEGTSGVSGISGFDVSEYPTVSTLPLCPLGGASPPPPLLCLVSCDLSLVTCDL